MPYDKNIVECSFLEAMKALDDGKFVHIGSMEEHYFFRKVDGQIWLVEFKNNVKFMRRGIAIMGNEKWGFLN